MSAAANFTGTVLSEPFVNELTGEECRQVFEYINGECTDRYVTITRYARKAVTR